MFKGLITPLVVVLVLLSGFIIFKNNPELLDSLLGRTSGVSVSGYRARVFADSKVFDVGENKVIKVYLSGEKIKDVTIAQIDLGLDRDYLTILSSRPGKFFKKAMEINMDNKKGSWVISIDPSTIKDKNSRDETQPILEVTVAPIKKTASKSIFILSSSNIYINQVGKFDIDGAPFEYEIE